MEWINVWRNTIPKFIATVDLILNEKKIDSNHNSNNETLFNLYQLSQQYSANL